MLRRFMRNQGQALVEFALAATLIFFLLAAAVDLGLIFFTLQGLHNAAQEGANYGSRWILDDPATGTRSLNLNAIRDRVRHESGDRGGIGFVNLLDLNNNDVPDVSPDTAHVGDAGATYDTLPDGTTRVIDDYIQVQVLRDTDLDGRPNDVPCTSEDMGSPTTLCFIEVAVSTDYDLVFGLAPAFGETRRITSRYVLAMRNTDAVAGDNSTPVAFEAATRVPTNTPIVATETPAPSPTPQGPVFVEFYGVPATLTDRTDTRFGAKAYDNRSGTGDGDGIDRVYFTIYKPDGTVLEDHSEGQEGYCVYGGNGPCNLMTESDYNSIKDTPGTYTIKAYARADDGVTSRDEYASFVIPEP